VAKTRDSDMEWRGRSSGILIAATVWSALLGPWITEVHAGAEGGRIRVEYVAPKDARHQAIYDLLRERHALERLQRLFSPLRLPSELVLQTSECEGIANAWYERGKVTICYELLNVIQQPIPKDVTWGGITHGDAVVGQFLYISAHEIGHGLFDLLNVPVFGNEEDAADQLATYFMLRLGKDQARRLIYGAAYYYRKHLQNPRVTLGLEAFSGAHSKPQQRFFNLLCMGYGANPAEFAEVVDKGYLPKSRSVSCQREYRRITAAFQQLILPHVDQSIAKEVLDEEWLDLQPH